MHGDDDDDEDIHSLGSPSECEEENERDEDAMDDGEFDDFDDPGMFEDEQQEELQGAETMCASAACKHIITVCACGGGGHEQRPVHFKELYRGFTQCSQTLGNCYSRYPNRFCAQLFYDMHPCPRS